MLRISIDHLQVPSLPPRHIAGALPRAGGPGAAETRDVLRSLALARVDVVVADAPMGTGAWEKPKHPRMAGLVMFGKDCFKSGWTYFYIYIHIDAHLKLTF